MAESNEHDEEHNITALQPEYFMSGNPADSWTDSEDIIYTSHKVSLSALLDCCKLQNGIELSISDKYMVLPTANSRCGIDNRTARILLGTVFEKGLEGALTDHIRGIPEQPTRKMMCRSMPGTVSSLSVSWNRPFSSPAGANVATLSEQDSDNNIQHIQEPQKLEMLEDPAENWIYADINSNPIYVNMIKWYAEHKDWQFENLALKHSHDENSEALLNQMDNFETNYISPENCIMFLYGCPELNAKICR